MSSNLLSSNESFIKSQESLVQGAIRTPKPIDILQTKFDKIINKYKASENAKITRKPVILLNEEKYDQGSKKESRRKELNRRRSKKTERRLDVEEHERALSEIKKIATIMDSSNTINKKSHSRVNSRSNLKLSEKIWGVEEDEDDEYEIFMGQLSSSENSSKSNLTYNSSLSVESDSNKNKTNSRNNENKFSNNSLNSVGFTNKESQKLVIPNQPNPIFDYLNVNNLQDKREIFFSKEDVFKKKIKNDDDANSYDSKKDEQMDEEKRLNEKKKKTKLKQFLKLHKENFLTEVPNALYTDIINESIKILTKTSQNYISQLGKKDESTIGSIKHLDHLKELIPSGNKYQQHIDNNSGKFGPGYYQLCAPIDENGQYVKLKEKILINSLESLNSVNSLKQ